MKVLIISHNPVSTYNNMGKTLKSLFTEFEKNELCQLYVYPTYPDVEVCSSYYRITDRDVLNSLYRFETPGNVINRIDDSLGGENVDNTLSMVNHKKNCKPLKRILRDIMWKMARWNSTQLNQWLEDEKPTCIFLAPGYAKFIYDIALVISKQRNIPIVTYICDDYYFVNSPKNILGKLQLRLLQRKTDEVMKKTTHLIAICEEVKELYSEKFGIPSTVIMTGANFELEFNRKISDLPQAISYFGNIGCNRYISLSEFGHALDSINKEKGTNIRLNIYTGFVDSKIKNCFENINAVQFCGFLTGKEFEEAMKSTDILLHAEAFDEESVDLVKHSVSTKIADSLVSGTPLIAYGPNSISSIKHLIRNNCAYIISSKKELHEKLLKCLFDQNMWIQLIQNALDTAMHYHRSITNSQVLKSTINKAEMSFYE